MIKWEFDEKTTRTRYEKLKRYYEIKGLNADNFNCKHYAACEKSQPNGVHNQYKGGTAGLSPFYDVKYKGKEVRVLVVGKESAYTPAESYGTTNNFIDRSKALLERINGARNPHIEGTLITLKKIFQVKTKYIFASYALSNALKCAFQIKNKMNKRTTRDNVQMKNNCFEYLVEEIKILEPTVLITQGSWSTYPFVNKLSIALGSTFKPHTILKISQDREYGLYKFPKFMCITSHHPSRLAQWEKNLAPYSLWPMIEQLRTMKHLPTFDQKASAEYEELVRPIIDKKYLKI